MVCTMPLGFAGRAGGVEDIERMLGVERLGRAIVAGLGHQLVPPVVAAFVPCDLAAGALVDDDMLHRRTAVQRLVDRGFQLHFAAAAIGSNPA